MSRTFRNRSEVRWSGRRTEEFRCRHCRMFVTAVRFGGRHRNHCPFCLYSRHLDRSRPGDRASACGGSMAPVGVASRADGELLAVHRCLTCGVERSNRIAADDDLNLVLALPRRQRRSARRAGERRSA